MSEVGVLVEGPAVSGSVVVDLAVTRSALGASCRSEGRWARSRVRGKRVDGRVCSVTVAAVRLKEVWLCDPEGIRRPEPHPGVHLHAVKGKLSCIGLSIKYQFTAIVYMVRQCMRRFRWRPLLPSQPLWGACHLVAVPDACVRLRHRPPRLHA